VHEHQTVPGIAEDIHQIIQRLKALTLVMAENVDEVVLQLTADKAGAVTAQQIVPNASVEIVHPDHLLFTLQEDREIAGELYVKTGRGYVEASQHEVNRSLPVDLVRIDAVYSPVRRANFTVYETRVGQRTDFDSLTLAVETNGAVAPENAVAYAAAMLQEHLRFFLDFGRLPEAPVEPEQTGEKDGAELRDLLEKAIDDCGLSVRSINSLKNSGIGQLRDLVQYTEDDLLKVKNVGEKALHEIGEMLRGEGLRFGMEFEDRDGVPVITNPGHDPVTAAVTDQPTAEEQEGA